MLRAFLKKSIYTTRCVTLRDLADAAGVAHETARRWVEGETDKIPTEAVTAWVLTEDLAADFRNDLLGVLYSGKVRLRKPLSEDDLDVNRDGRVDARDARALAGQVGTAAADIIQATIQAVEDDHVSDDDALAGNSRRVRIEELCGRLAQSLIAMAERGRRKQARPLSPPSTFKRGTGRNADL